MDTPAPSRPAAPAVVAVVVTRNPGSWFDACVEALAEQDYPNLAFLFLDAASDDDPTPRVARALPDAYVRRLEENRGYGWAANHVTEIVDGASFYCFLHDDAAPDPGVIATMVNEALRSNAGIVGAKLVQFDDHRRLLQIGETIDKTGERLSEIEPGELDQEQHDAVSDVFVVPSGCMLVRADLFAALGRFDEEIDTLNDDLNLCWRAHVAGARVVVSPDAVVGHVEALGERQPATSRRQRLIRHRLRTMLVCYSAPHLARVLPQAFIVAVLEVLYSLVAGRRGQAGDVIGAWRWNWRRRKEIREWRARVSEFRGVPDAEIRPLQARGSARFTRFVRGQTTRGGARSDRASAAWTDTRDAFQAGRLRLPIVAWVFVVALLVFGGRHLVFEPVPAVGGFLDFDLGPRKLLDQWLSGWRPTGLGSASPAPTAFGLLAGLGTLFLGAMGTLRRVLLLGPLLLGIVGTTRLLRVVASTRARIVGLVVYATLPVGYDAIAHARWGSLVVFGAAPWIVGHLGRAAGWAPFASRDGDPAMPTSYVPGPATRIVSLAVVVALAATVEPAIWVVLPLVALGLVLGSVLTGTRRGALPVLATAAAAVVVSIVLHAPWAIDLALVGDAWDALVGVRGADPAMGLGDLLRLDVGPVGGGPAAWGVLLAASLPLLIGRDWRFEWAVRAWTLLLVLVGATWAGERGWLPVDLPAAETMLAPAAVALALAVALGVVAFETDLRAFGFGWRQFAAAAAAGAVVVSAIPVTVDAVDGRWHLSRGDLGTTFGFLDDEDPGFRVLWVGDADVLPMPGFRLHGVGQDGVVYATSDDGLPGIIHGWAGAAQGRTPLIEEALQLAVDRETFRLGRLLAPMAVRYIVVPDATAPRPLGGVERARPAAVVDALAHQLDLTEVAVNPTYVVYRNEAALAATSIIPSFSGAGGPFDVDVEVLDGALPALTAVSGPTSSSGEVAAGARIIHAATADDGWELLVDGRAAPRLTLFGWAQGFELTTGGQGVLRYDTSPLRYAVLAFQLLFWAGALRTLTVARRRRRAVLAMASDPEGLPGPERDAPALAGVGTAIESVASGTTEGSSGFAFGDEDFDWSDRPRVETSGDDEEDDA